MCDEIVKIKCEVYGTNSKIRKKNKPFHVVSNDVSHGRVGVFSVVSFHTGY